MTALRLVRRRARAHTGLLLLVLLQVALTTAAVAGATGYVSLAEREGARATLEAAEPRDAHLQVAARLADDRAAQDAAATAILAEHLGRLPVAVHRDLATPPLSAALGDAALPAAVLWSAADLPGASTLVEGSWPRAVDETALQADAAARLGLAVGDTVTVTVRDTPTPLTLTGTWLPQDPDDARWFGDPLAAEGSADDGDVAGPYVVAPEVVQDLAGVRYQRWTLALDAGALLPRDLGALRDALADAVDALEDDGDVDVSGLTTLGDLPATLDGLDARLGGVRGVTSAAVLLVVLTGVIALGQMARLLADVRLAETLVLRSRGTSVAQVTAASLVEGAATATTGAVVGAVGAWAALAATGVGTPPLSGLLASAAGAAVLGSAVLALRARGRAAAVVRQGRSDAAGRTLRAARAGAVVAALAAAGLAWWQLDRFGSPVFTGVDGRVHVDPLAAGAVALGLLTVALGAAVLLVPTTAAAAGGAQRRRDLMPVLTLRELARHTSVHAVTVVLVVLAAGAGAFVGAYAGTLAGWRADVGRAAAGADVRLDLAAAPAGALPAAGADAGLPAELAPDLVVPARVLSAAGGGASGELVALPTAYADRLGLPRGAEALRSEDSAPALPLPAGTTGLALSADLTTGLADPPDLAARVWLTDATGELLLLDAGPGERADVGTLPGGDPAPAAFAWTVAVPPAAEGWSVAAVDLAWADVPDTPEVVAALAWLATQTDPAVLETFVLPPQPRVTVELTRLAAGGAGSGAGSDDGSDATSDDAAPADADLLASAEGWEAAVLVDDRAVEAAGAAVTLERDVARAYSGRPVRLLPAGPAGPLPVLVTEEWRAGFDVGIGDGTVLRVAGRDVDVTVVGEAPVVPGTAAARRVVVPGAVAPDDVPALAVLADLGLVNRMLLRTSADVPAPDTLWLVTDRPADVAAAVRAGTGRDGAGPDRADPTPPDGANDGAPRVVDVATADPGRDRLSSPAVVAAWLAAACALVVMLPGVASTALALGLARRREAAVLRALGVGPRQQARARGAELALVAGGAVVGGALGGLAVAWLTAGPLVRATAPGPAALPVAFAPDVAGAATAVGVAVALLAVVVVGYGAQVARQVRAATRVEEER